MIITKTIPKFREASGRVLSRAAKKGFRTVTTWVDPDGDPAYRMVPVLEGNGYNKFTGMGITCPTPFVQDATVFAPQATKTFDDVVLNRERARWLFPFDLLNEFGFATFYLHIAFTFVYDWSQPDSELPPEIHEIGIQNLIAEVVVNGTPGPPVVYGQTLPGLAGVTSTSATDFSIVIGTWQSGRSSGVRVDQKFVGNPSLSSFVTDDGDELTIPSFTFYLA